jgi:putative membrane protein
MADLSESDRQRVLQAIRDAEARTAGEFVVAVARESDGYHSMPLLAAACLSLLSAIGVWAVAPELRLPTLLLVQAIVMVSGLAVCSSPPLRRRLTPQAEQTRRVRRAACAMFLAQRMHTTSARSGILFYVSLAERRVELIADLGIDSRVTPGTWDGVIAAFVAEIRQGKLGHGLIAAVDAVADILARHFPPEPGRRNELPDRLIEL